MGDWVRRKLVKIKQKWAKTRHSKPEGSKNKGANHRKIKEGKIKRLKAQKEEFNEKLHETPKRGGNIYICKIYMKKRIYVYI